MFDARTMWCDFFDRVLIAGMQNGMNSDLFLSAGREFHRTLTRSTCAGHGRRQRRMMRDEDAPDDTAVAVKIDLETVMGALW